MRHVADGSCRPGSGQRACAGRPIGHGTPGRQRCSVEGGRA
jgi:hypothetical protein